jgi:DNA-binding NtrC family response regulator
VAESCDVLVIDDEAVVRDGVRLVLEDAGLRVAAAEDLRGGLDHAMTKDCRVVLCDLMLPDGAGLELVRTLHALRPELPVVLITGYPTSENAVSALEAGARDFLAKPFTESELLAVVQRALEQPSAPHPRKPT